MFFNWGGGVALIVSAHPSRVLNFLKSDNVSQKRSAISKCQRGRLSRLQTILDSRAVVAIQTNKQRREHWSGSRGGACRGRA